MLFSEIVAARAMAVAGDRPNRRRSAR